MQNINGNKKFQSELNLRLKSTHFDKNGNKFTGTIVYLSFKICKFCLSKHLAK